mgnify:FL=1
MLGACVGRRRKRRWTRNSLIATRSFLPFCPSGWSSILNVPPLMPLQAADAVDSPFMWLDSASRGCSGETRVSDCRIGWSDFSRSIRTFDISLPCRM